MRIVFDWISRILSFILCIVLFVVMCVFLTLSTFRSIANTPKISEMVAELNTEDVFGEELINSLYEEAKQYDVDPKIIDEIINDEEFKALVGKILGNTIEAILYSREEPLINTGEVIKVLNKQIDIIVESEGIKLTQEQRNLIVQEIEIEINNIINDMSIEEVLEEEFDEKELATIRFIFGGSLNMILTIIIILIITIIALIRWSIYRFAIWTGVTTTLAGGVFAIAGLGIREIITIEYAEKMPIVIMEILNKHIFNLMFIIGTITIVVGAVQIAYYLAMKKRKESVKLNISY